MQNDKLPTGEISRLNAYACCITYAPRRMLPAVSPSFTKAIVVTRFSLEDKSTPSYDSSYTSRELSTVWSPFCSKGSVAIILLDLDLHLLRSSLSEIPKAILPKAKLTSHHHHEAVLTIPTCAPNSIHIALSLDQ